MSPDLTNCKQRWFKALPSPANAAGLRHFADTTEFAFRPQSGLSQFRLKLIAHLNQIAVRIIEIDRQDFAHRPGPLARPVDNLYILAFEVQDNRVQRGVGKQAKISATRDGVASDAWR